MIFENPKFFLTLVYMTHGKKSKTIYSDMEYNRYMTDYRNQKLGNPVSKKIPKFVITIIAIKQLHIIIGG